MLERIHTLQYQIEELKRCLEDPIYFIETYVTTMHPTKGHIKLKLYPYQKELINYYQNHNYNISIVARQCGKTEVGIAYIIWYMIFNCDKTIALISNKLANSKELIKRISNAIYYLPDWIKLNVEEDNSRGIKLENGSKIITAAASYHALRGYSVNFIYFDEFAYVPHKAQLEIWNSIQPALAYGAKVIVSSSVSEHIELVHELYHSAVRGITPFHASKYTWECIPGRDETFKEDIIKIIGQVRWEQEFECKWIEEVNAS